MKCSSSTTSRCGVSVMPTTSRSLGSSPSTYLARSPAFPDRLKNSRPSPALPFASFSVTDRTAGSRDLSTGALSTPRPVGRFRRRHGNVLSLRMRQHVDQRRDVVEGYPRRARVGRRLRFRSFARGRAEAKQLAPPRLRSGASLRPARVELSSHTAPHGIAHLARGLPRDLLRQFPRIELPCGIRVRAKMLAEKGEHLVELREHIGARRLLGRAPRLLRRARRNLRCYTGGLFRTILRRARLDLARELLSVGRRRRSIRSAKLRVKRR